MRTTRLPALFHWGIEALMLLMAVVSVYLLVIFGWSDPKDGPER